MFSHNSRATELLLDINDLHVIEDIEARHKNTLVTQMKCYRMTLISVELTLHVGVGTRYYIHEVSM